MTNNAHAEAAFYSLMWTIYGIVAISMIVPPFVLAFVQTVCATQSVPLLVWLCTHSSIWILLTSAGIPVYIYFLDGANGKKVNSTLYGIGLGFSIFALVGIFAWACVGAVMRSEGCRQGSLIAYTIFDFILSILGTMILGGMLNLEHCR